MVTSATDTPGLQHLVFSMLFGPSDTRPKGGGFEGARWCCLQTVLFVQGKGRTPSAIVAKCRQNRENDSNTGWLCFEKAMLARKPLYDKVEVHQQPSPCITQIKAYIKEPQHKL